jgi:hypothetical protein
MSEITGDMTSAVEAAFAASSTPEPAPTTTVEPGAPSASETATGDVSQAAAPPTETTTTTEPGPIPYPRFKEVNDKWTAASKELEGYGWAKGINPQLAQSAIQLLNRAQQNPLAFTEELEALRDHPQFGPQLRSWAARTLGTRIASRQTELPVDETMPEPDLHFEDGRKSYSDQQLQKRDQWLLKQWESKIDEKVAPLANKSAATEKYVADQVYSSIQTKATADAKTEIDALRQQYPQFDEHKATVAEVMEANPTYTLKQAWADVFISKVGPQLAGQQAAAVRQKTQAGSANPSRPSGAPPSAPKDFHEALAQHFPART